MVGYSPFIPQKAYLSSVSDLSSKISPLRYLRKCYERNLVKVYALSWVDAQLLSHVQLFMTPWTVAHQVPLSMGVSRQEYWSVLPCRPPGDLPNPGIEPGSPALAGRFFTAEPLLGYST